MSINISEKKLKSKVKIGERVAVVENIKYPHFESQKHTKLCKKMNDFYSSVAEKYSHHAQNKLVKKIKLNRLTCKLPMTVGMNYTISLCDEKVISVVIDLTFTEGKNIKTRRFSQLWSVANKEILPIDEVVKTDRKSKKKIYSLIASIAKQNGENPAFGYFEDYLIRLSKKFDIRNCFLVPKGLCFFVNAGVLSPVKYGAGSFIFTFDALRELVNGEFVPKNGEKESQNTDIVNNI